MNFPQEFDINIYKNENRHLQSMSNADLMTHYNFYGRHEGLVSSQIKNRNNFIDLVPSNQMILEIGPLASPSMDVSRGNVHTIDYFTKEELQENYKNDPHVDLNKICDVTYVLKENIKYSDVVPSIFNHCFSSHNIEHVPCLITFLNNVSSILVPSNSSYLFLCIPDYRYCFDHYRYPSNIFEVLDAFHNGRTRPSAISNLESAYVHCHNDSVQHWNTLDRSIRNIFVDMNDRVNFMNSQKQRIINEISRIKKRIEECKEEYFDSHCWTFTPDVFRNIIEILFETGYIDFQTERIYKTLKGSNEFYAILKKTGS